MKGVVDFPKNIEMIKREASEWIARMESGELSKDEKDDLRKWLSTSPEHQKQLQRLSQLWDKMSEIGERNVSQKPQTQAQKGHLFAQTFNFLSFKTVGYFALILMLPMIVYFYNLSQFTALNGRYVTKIGEQKSVILTDGSEVLLNTNSVVDVLYSGSKRNIELVKGEANFKVTKDKHKPFTVKAGTGDVRALGTSFSVRLDGDKVNVLVSHGTVRVRAKDDENTLLPVSNTSLHDNNEVIVDAGNNVIFDHIKVESVIQKSVETLSKNLSWKTGFLAFDNEPLSAVVEEISRYTSIKIIIADEDIQRLKVGGYYPISNLQSIFSTLELNLGLVVEKVGEESYYITDPHS